MGGKGEGPDVYYLWALGLGYFESLARQESGVGAGAGGQSRHGGMSIDGVYGTLDGEHVLSLSLSRWKCIG